LALGIVSAPLAVGLLAGAEALDAVVVGTAFPVILARDDAALIIAVIGTAVEGIVRHAVPQTVAVPLGQSDTGIAHGLLAGDRISPSPTASQAVALSIPATRQRVLHDALTQGILTVRGWNTGPFPAAVLAESTLVLRV
jgi:hypothetical protein